MDQLYLALVTAPEFHLPTAGGLIGAVYYSPGSVCYDCDNTMYICFLLHETYSDRYISVGRDCVQEYYRVDQDLAKSWCDALRTRLRQLPLDGLRSTSDPQPAMYSDRRLAEGLYWIAWLENHHFARGLLQRMLEGEQLTKNQRAKAREIIQERGGLRGIRRRRDHAWRLLRLLDLDLSDADRVTIKDLHRTNEGRKTGLTAQQERVIWAVEEAYLPQRRGQTEQDSRAIGQSLATAYPDCDSL